jgi:hypothetical protein
MSYDQRQPPRTDTTRHLNKGTDDSLRGLTGYFEGARMRSERFAESTTRLREVREEIDAYGRQAHQRPTGVLSGGDVDIAYYYLSVAVGIAAVVYSVVGTIFMFHGGGTELVGAISNRWAAGPAVAITDALFNMRTLGALVLQAILYIVMIGSRRYRQSWQYISALLASAALTYVGWSPLLIQYGVEPLTSFTNMIPAVVVGGAVTWALMWGASEIPLPRYAMVAVVLAGVLAGAMGVPSMIHWLSAILALCVDQVARRMMVIG